MCVFALWWEGVIQPDGAAHEMQRQIFMPVIDLIFCTRVDFANPCILPNLDVSDKLYVMIFHLRLQIQLIEVSDDASSIPQISFSSALTSDSKTKREHPQKSLQLHAVSADSFRRFSSSNAFE